jgi:hypothetical protein
MVPGTERSEVVRFAVLTAAVKKAVFFWDTASVV